MKTTLSRRAIATGGLLLTAGTFVPAGDAHAVLEWLAEKAAETRRKVFEAVTDRALVDAMYLLSDNGKREAVVPELQSAGYKLNQLTPGSLSMERLADRLAGNMGEAQERMAAYLHDLDTDAVSKLYVQVVKGRGNVAKAYKSRMGARLNGLFKQPMTMGPNRREWFDRDNPIIEWTPGGRIVSVLVHAHQASTSLGVVLTRYSSVFFGPNNARHVENSIRNSEFADFELQTL